MNCDDARQEISAAVDGEASAGDSEALREHLAGCADCRAWQERVHQLTRHVRLGTDVRVPDRTDELLAELTGDRVSGTGATRAPFAAEFWRSPLRGPWLTSALGLVLLCGLPIVMITGLLSNASYNPRIGNVGLQGRGISPLDFYLFTWPTEPHWLYAVTQGIHISLGLALIPVVLVKQWSVLPRLFSWPPFRSPAHALERISLIFLVGGIMFEIVTGVLFIEYYSPFRFDFTAAHYYGAWVFFGAFLLHAGLKLPTMRASLAVGRELAPLRAGLADTRSEPPDWAVRSLVAPAPAPATMSRRALLGAVGAGSVMLGIQGIAQAVGAPIRALAWMLPRGTTLGTGPNDFPVNGTFASIGVPVDTIRLWKLQITGTTGLALEMTRDELLAVDQHSYSLPLACREGWTTTQLWTGVRLRDLASAMNISGDAEVDMVALDGGAATLAANQVAADETLLVLKVNGTDLSLDHGFPARVIVPNGIAVNCLKWVTQLHFRQFHHAPAPSHTKMPGMEGM